MVHDVFISHSTKDAKVAGSICQHLEQNGIHCWIAPRDIPPSADWPASIAEAIPNCRVVVLILSSNSNKSKQVEREIGIAADRELPVIPFRIEEVNPEGSLGFFLGSTQRIDAVKPPLEDHLQKLNESVARLIGAEFKPNVEKHSHPGPQSSSPLEVSSLKELVEASQNSRVLLISFASGAAWLTLRDLKKEVFPFIEKTLAARKIRLCYAHGRGLFLPNAFGEELKNLGASAIGAYLFENGKLTKHKEVSKLNLNYLTTARKLLAEI